MKRYPYPIRPMPNWLAVTTMVLMFLSWAVTSVLILVSLSPGSPSLPG